MTCEDKLTLSRQLCFPLYACSREIIRAYYPVLSAQGLTYTQYIVLMALWENKILTVKELCALLYLDSGTLTPLLKKMEAKGLLTRRRCPNDERCVMVHITEKGEALRPALKTAPDTICQKLALTEEEYQTVHALLYKMLNRLT